MAEVCSLREAARLAGVSPGRLYRAIETGRLTAAPGGGPGKSTLVSLDALQAFCAHEGLTLRDAGAPRERAERSIGTSGTFPAPVDPQQALEVLAERLERSIAEAIDRAVERVAERLLERLTLALPPPERVERSERTERPERLERAPSASKAAVVARLRELRARGLSLQGIADCLNAEGVVTLSGRGTWKKGTVGNLLAEGGEEAR